MPELDNNTNTSYQAKKNEQKEQEQKSAEKVGSLAARGALDYVTAGQAEKLHHVPVAGKALKKAENVVGKGFAKADRISGGNVGKVSKKLDDAGLVDAAEKGLDTFGGNIGSNTGSQNATTNAGSDIKKQQSSTSSLDRDTNSSPKNNNSLLGRKKSPFSKFLGDSGEGNGDSDINSETSNSNTKESDFDLFSIIMKHKKIGLFGFGFFFFFILMGGVICIIASSSEDGSGNPGGSTSGNTTCTYTSNADGSTKRDARFTTYTDLSMGGSIGDVSMYIREGKAYYDSTGFTIWKGGTTSKTNGKVYGESGKEYLIVATANRAIIGNTFHEYPKIKYYEYGDTFTLEFPGSNGNESKQYNAIVLDSCGACMDWTFASTGAYRPKSDLETNRCQKSEGYKIDIHRRLNNFKGYPEMGYIMDGTSGNVCQGEVDLGNLVTGINDTKLLQGQSLESLYGGSTGIESLNRLIKANAEKYGAGTGKGTAAAAITLINSVKEKGYRLPYYWAGGHGGISDGAKPNWGSKTSTSCSIYGTCYAYDSLDCSGFVSWAIKNGGCTNFTAHTSSTFGSIGKKIDKSQVKAGDILVNPGSHVVLVVQNNAGKIILAESSGGQGGVHFTDYDTSSYPRNSSYYFVDMTDFYNSSSCK